MVDATDAVLHEREEAIDRLRMRAVHVDARRMVEPTVRVTLLEPSITGVVVRVDGRGGKYALSDLRPNRVAETVRDDLRVHHAATLDDGEHNGAPLERRILRRPALRCGAASVDFASLPPRTLRPARLTREAAFSAIGAPDLLQLPPAVL